MDRIHGPPWDLKINLAGQKANPAPAAGLGLHHLFRAKELLAYRLASVHNLRFVVRLAEEMRTAILRGEFSEYRLGFLRRFRPTDENTRVEQKRKWTASMDRRGT